MINFSQDFSQQKQHYEKRIQVKIFKEKFQPD